MKTFWKQFFLRGLMFAWGGPVIVAVVWLIIHLNGELPTLSVTEAVTGVLSSVLLAFIAAGISAIHLVEKLPAPIAAMLHLLVLYADYLLVYLLNGWIVPGSILTFTAIFLAAYAVIWVTVYFISKAKVRRMNESIRKLEDSAI